MIGMLICLLAVTGYALTLSRITKLRPELTVAPACCLIVLLLLAGGAVGVLPIARICIIVIGVLMIPLALVVDRPIRLLQLLSPGMAFFCAATVTLIIATADAKHLHWDEFSHWGLASKFIILADRLPAEPGDVHFLAYPVSGSLFHYLFAWPSGFSEGRVIASNGILQIAVLLPLFAKLRWRDLTTLVPLTAVAITAAPAFYPLAAWNSVLIDSLLSLMTAAPVLIYLAGGRDSRAILCSLPVFVVLPLLKDMGLILAVLPLAVITADQILRSRLEQKAAAKKALVLAALAIAGGRMIWAAYLMHIDAPSVFRIQTEALFSDHARLVFAEWCRRMLLAPLAATVAFLLFVGSTLLVIRSRIQRVYTLAIHTVCMMFALSYCVLHLLLFIVVFGTYEGQRLASFERYVSNAFLAWAIISVATLLMLRKELGRLLPPALIGLVVIFAGATSIRVYRQYAILQDQWRTRALVAERLGEMRSIPPRAFVYSVWNGTDGREHYMAAYELSTRRSNFHSFSFGPKRNAEDIWSADIDPPALAAMTDRYDFLFLGRADDAFWGKYGALFSARGGNGWYKIKPGPEPFSPAVFAASPGVSPLLDGARRIDYMNLPSSR